MGAMKRKGRHHGGGDGGEDAKGKNESKEWKNDDETGRSKGNRVRRRGIGDVGKERKTL